MTPWSLPQSPNLVSDHFYMTLLIEVVFNRKVIVVVSVIIRGTTLTVKNRFQASQLSLRNSASRMGSVTV